MCKTLFFAPLVAISVISTLNGAALPQEDVSRLAAQLGEGDAAAKVAAVAEIRRLMESDPVEMNQAVAGLRSDWGLAMLKGGLHKELLELTDEMMPCAVPLPQKVQDLMYYRVRALLALNRPQDALADAKRYFNVADMTQTERALQLLGEALAAAHPDEPGIAQKFKMQQMKGANAPSATQPADLPDNLLKGIKVDGAKYEALLERFPSDNYFGLMSRGNLYLLADRPDDALWCFQRLQDRQVPGGTEYVRKQQLESVARAIKAQDGAIGRANAYVRALQGQ